MGNERKSIDENFLNPEKIIGQLDIRPGSSVADFGCASGYFSLPFAQAIGSEGELIAIDILPQALETVESRAKSVGLSNVRTKRANLEKEAGSGLEGETLDWVIMKGVLFQNRDKGIIIKEAYRVLKPGGRAIIVEWGDKDFSIGPHKGLRVPKEALEELTKKEGFSLDGQVEAGKFHYAFVAVK